MKKSTFISLFLMLLASGCTQSGNYEAQLLVQLAQINTHLQSIDKKLEKKTYYKKNSKRKKKEYKGVDHIKLNEIKFPKEITAESIDKYVFSILEISKSQDSWSPKDPQVDLLSQIGEEYIEILFKYSTYFESWLRFYSLNAINVMATEKSRKYFPIYLKKSPRLVITINKNGWQNDVRIILLEGIKNKWKNLPHEWVESVVSFKDPSTYEELAVYYIEGGYKYSIYERLKDLPDFPLEEATIKAWKNAKYSDSWQSRMLSTIAVQYGQADALEYIVNLLKNSSKKALFQEHIVAFINVTNAKVKTKQEVITWYDLHKEQLSFNKKSMKFEVN